MDAKKVAEGVRLCPDELAIGTEEDMSGKARRKVDVGSNELVWGYVGR